VTAQVFLRTGDHAEAENKARYALELLTGRDDHVNELGSAQLVLGRALLEQERFDEADAAFRAADDSFARMESDGHRSAASLARGDLAARRGDTIAAAAHYRSAAQMLQDVRF
jgi:tetratricopeptide (TPR) repeat protein